MKKKKTLQEMAILLFEAQYLNDLHPTEEDIQEYIQKTLQYCGTTPEQSPALLQTLQAHWIEINR